MKIKIGDILKVNPSKALVVVVRTKMELVETVYIEAWLKNYWNVNHNLKLPIQFEIVWVNFPSHNKEYAYPKYKKCFKRPLRQKKAKKFFNVSHKENHPNIILKLKRNADRFGDEFFDDDGIMEHEVFDL